MNNNVNGGHSPYARGASGYLDELNEDRAVIAHLIPELERRGCHVTDGSSTASTVQGDLTHQVNVANASGAEVALSIHFKAGGGTGTECYYYGGDSTGARYAADMSARVADALGLRNRGAKDGSGFYWIANTNMTALLLEVCFVDSQQDANAYHATSWDALIGAIADALTGEVTKPEPAEPPKPTVWDGPGTEYAGADRYETARIVAEAAHPNANAVMRTKGSSPYDALTGMWRAGQLEAQVVYAEDYLYLHDGVDGMYIGSDNRFGTNRYFNDFQCDVKGAELGDTCFVVPGDSWADGMAIAPVSYRFGIPIILYEDHRNFFAQIAQFAHVIVIGNTVLKLEAETDRIAGANRYETAIKVAERYCAKKWGTINICTGESFSDGIAAAQLTGRYPLLFAEGEETLEAIKRHADEIGAFTWIGGLASVGYEARMGVCEVAWLDQ